MIRRIKSKRLRWTGHVARIEGRSDLKIKMLNLLERGWRKLGLKREGNIRMDLK